MVVLALCGAVAALLSMTLTYVTAVQSPSRTMVKGPIDSASVAARTSELKTTATAKVKGTPTTISNQTTKSIVGGSSDCKVATPMRGLSGASSPQLRKLDQYEKVCSSGIIPQMSFFVATPTTLQEAAEEADYVAGRLREFAKYGITPLVFIEPTSSTGLLNMSDYQAGKFDAALDAYFAALRSHGVSDAMMGTWVPFPEGNIPVWTSVDPNLFADCVSKTINYQKKYFPSSKASVMLDSLTYPRANDWSGGRAVSLLPYLTNITPGLLDSVGLQGFPWSPAANEAGPDNGAVSDYLRTDLIAEAARSLGVNNVWLNTGTFSVKYANQPARQVVVSPEQRHAKLNQVVQQAKSLNAQGLRTAVHLFAENKSKVAEATDWSYWPDAKLQGSSVVVFKSFAHELQAANIPLWLFDTE